MITKTINITMTVILLFSLGVCPQDCFADILRLKRGVSFEGKLIEERADSYVFEMELGVVTFEKDEVDSLEVSSDLQNKQIQDDWKKESLQKDSGDISDGESSEKIDMGGLVRYKGRYVSPEVFAIIEKEREIKERRQQFIRRQRIEAEREKEIKKEKEALLKGVPEKVEIEKNVSDTASSSFLSEKSVFGENRATPLSGAALGSRDSDSDRTLDYGSSI